MASIVKSPPLDQGDLIGLVAPAGPPRRARDIDAAAAALERLGFSVRLGAHIRKRNGFLAGKDSERAADINRMFADKKVRAIVCLRGGNGATRILPLIDYRAARRNAKLLCGYSDITALELALLAKAGLGSLHGPVGAAIADPAIKPYTLSRFLQAVMGEGQREGICAGYADRSKTVEVIRAGQARGRLIGGNLCVLCHLIGTPYLPSFRGSILFLEDIGEEPYRIDRMLTHLHNAGILAQVRGVALGIFRDCEEKPTAGRKPYRRSCREVLRERLGSLKVPVVAGLPFGHVPFNATISQGGFATIDGRGGDLIVE